MLAAWIIFPHFSVASTMNLQKSAGVIDFGTLPTSRHHFVINESRIDLFVKLINDLGGRVLRRNQAIPHACLVTRYELADRRNVWQCLRTCLTGHSERVLRADSVSDQVAHANGCQASSRPQR